MKRSRKNEKTYLVYSLILIVIISGTFLIENASTVGSMLENQIHGERQKNIVVKFDEGVGNERALEVLNSNNLKVKYEINPIGIKVISVPEGKAPEEVIRKLWEQHGKEILFTEIDEQIELSFEPNDPKYPEQWHLDKIDAPQAWDSENGYNITIAIADTGIDPDHPDLVFIPGWNFYDNNDDTRDIHGHGTAVAGTAAAAGNNLNQIAGVAFAAKVMPLRISDANGYGYYSTISNAITYAADKGVKVISISYAACGSLSVASAAKYMKEKGGLVIVSEGNSGENSFNTNNPDIICVSATDNSDNKASWSSYGDDVDVAAPGTSILTTINGGGIGYKSGTSFSAPLTAGVIGLIWSANPTLTNNQVEETLFKTADDLGSLGWDQNFGWGRINAGKAVGLAKNTYAEQPLAITNYYIGEKTGVSANIYVDTNLPSLITVTYWEARKGSRSLTFFNTESSQLSTSHVINLQGLSSSTTYNYKIIARNSDSSKTAETKTLSFKTLRK